jgi:hypothetical protein
MSRIPGPPRSPGRPADLLELAEAVLSGHEALPRSGWQRTCALLARQALESTLDDLMDQRAPQLAHRPARYQVLCLPVYMKEPGVAGRINHLWWSLATAGRHHAYELAPTAVELRGWLDDVAETIATLSSTAAYPPSSHPVSPVRPPP